MSEENSEKSLVPRLRFPEFRKAEGWNGHKLIDAADRKIRWSFIGGPFGSNLKSSDYVKDGVRVIQLQNIGDGEFIDDYQIFTSEEKADELLSNNIYPHEIILSKMGDPVGRACLIPDSHDRYVMCSDGIRLAVNEREYNKHFIFFLINSAPFRSLVEKTATGSTRKRIGIDELKDLPFSAPIREEQHKIADCLSSLDELITAETQKLDALKTHKKGLMQQLFPREGETVPQLRFPEFREAGEWKEARLGDIGSVRMCKRILKEQTSPRGDIPFYKIGTFGGVPDAYISREVFENFRNSYPFPKNGAVLISAAGTIGRTVRYNGELAYFQDSNIVWLDNSEKLIADNFLFHLYQLIDWSPSVGAIQRLYNENILGAQVKFPSISEQQRIAASLSSLDNLITAQSQKIDALKTHKKGLMQQLFPVLDEVPA